MHLFYSPDIEKENLKPGALHALPEDESIHAQRVLRLKTGDELVLTDGRGHWIDALITKSSKRECVVEFLKIVSGYGKRDFYLHMAVAPTKNIKRFDWFLEKATEMGVDEITPLITQHSERREIKTERSKKVITAAMKQSLKAYHPTLNEAVSFDDFISKCTGSRCFMAHYEGGEQLLLRDALDKGSDVVILVGPEGDFSKEEVQKAKQAGILTVSLGESRLRVETAALASVFTVNMINL